MRHPKMLSPDETKFVEDCLNSGESQDKERCLERHRGRIFIP